MLPIQSAPQYFYAQPFTHWWPFAVQYLARGHLDKQPKSGIEQFKISPSLCMKMVWIFNNNLLNCNFFLTKLLSVFHNLKERKISNSYCWSTIGRSTFHGLGVGLAAALTHRVEELVHLLQWERVVQRLQRVDRGHHGAAFKPCSTDRRGRNTADLTASASVGGGAPTLQLSVHVGCSAAVRSVSRHSAAIFVC